MLDKILIILILLAVIIFHEPVIAILKVIGNIIKSIFGIFYKK